MPGAQFDIVVIGGGAAGFFAALRAAELHPEKRICILEKTSHLLSKVKISGGGRCNVTHACFDQKKLTAYYPRGEKELLGPFHQFMTFDTISWFAERGVEIKTEADGRMFPVTDDSQTIIDCFLNEAAAKGVKIITGKGVKDFEQKEKGFVLRMDEGEDIEAGKIIFCTGSSKRVWDMFQNKGIAIAEPVPSLFTFNYKNKPMNDLMGLAVPMAEIKIVGSPFEAQGPLLFTHWGFSGPAVLRLSAWAARWLAERNYHFEIRINFAGKQVDELMEDLERIKSGFPARQVANERLTYVPSRLWELMATLTGVDHKRWADVSRNDLNKMVTCLGDYKAEITGKSTFKEEFVTCGGIDLKEVNMKTMECKKIPGLFFAGECVNIDAITGGFNFQAAWTTGYIAGSSV